MPDMGRPSTYTDELLEVICDRLAQGEPLAVICRDDGMPTDRTVRNWMAADKVASAIARAREIGFDVIAAECLDIADDKSGDVRLVRHGSEDDDVHEVCNTEFVQRAKLRIDTRLKLLSKWDPKRYGDLIKVGDPNGESLTVEIVRFGANPPSE